MPTVRTTDGVTLSFTDEGEGQPVVLVAGFSAPATSWGTRPERCSTPGIA